MTGYTEKVSEATGYIRSKSPIRPSVAVVLGSGLGSIADSLPDSTTIPYKSIPNFNASSVPGHAGNLVLCKAWGHGIAFMQGRFHYYEGLSMAEVAFPIRVLNALGAMKLIVTNASGGISDDLVPGSIMIIEDHINLMGANPLVGIPQAEGTMERFVDMVRAYDAEYMDIAVAAGVKTSVTVKIGILASVPGPCYETPAEILMLKSMGADAVSMSTVPEVIMARYLGMKVLGISLVSNRAAGLSNESPSHAEVLETARSSRDDFGKLLFEIIFRIAKLLP